MTPSAAAVNVPIKPISPTQVEPKTPLTSAAREKIQTEVITQQRAETEKAKAQMPQAIVAKIPATATARMNPSLNTVTIKDPAKGSTVVLDSKTGKPALSYSRTTGTAFEQPSAGTRQQVVGSVATATGPGGYTKLVDSAKGVERVSFHGSEMNRTIVNNTTVVINKTVIINNQTVVIHNDRPIVRTFNPFGGGYVETYHPSWWGQPRVMNEGWVIDGGRFHVYGSFFAYGAFVPMGYQSPWWSPSDRFVSWEARPLVVSSWDRYYANWGWGWRAENYYAGYYAPIVTYRNLGYWIADYYFQRELESERLSRLAAEQYADYVAEQNQEWVANSVAIAQRNIPVEPIIMDRLADQAEQMVVAIHQGRDLFASQLIENGHIFTVESTLRETAVIQGTVYQCRLQPGDLIKRDRRYDVDVEPVRLDDGSIAVDEFGNVVNTTYVTMRVLSSKRHSCARGASVVVQLDALQGMLGEEKARIQEGMEFGVSLNLQP